MPPKNKPMKPTPKTRTGYAKAAWEDTMKKASASPMGGGAWNPATWAVGATAAMNAAVTKKDPYAKPMKASTNQAKGATSVMDSVPMGKTVKKAMAKAKPKGK